MTGTALEMGQRERETQTHTQRYEQTQSETPTQFPSLPSPDSYWLIHYASEKTMLPPLNCFCSFVSGQLTIVGRVCFYALYSVPFLFDYSLADNTLSW